MEKSSFFNAQLQGESYDRTYLAEDFANYFASFIGNGIFPTPSTNLQVISDGTSMEILIQKGKAWINGYYYENTDNLKLKLEVADGLLNRIDRIVLRLDFISRDIKAYVKKGTFATTPTSPLLTRNADIYEIGIADIKINRGVLKVTQADITDIRQNSTYCGLVTGTVQQIDSTNLFAQFQNSFDQWFTDIQDKLTADVAGSLQGQIDDINLNVFKFRGMLTNENLNDITTEGNYVQSVVSNATGGRNYPNTQAGNLVVMSNDSLSHVYQIYQTTLNCLYFRRRYSSTGWSEWTTIADESKVLKFRYILTTEDLNNITHVGNYVQGGSANATSQLNYPAKSAGNLIVTTNENGNHTSQLYHATSNYVYTRYLSGGKWTEWRMLTPEISPTENIITYNSGFISAGASAFIKKNGMVFLNLRVSKSDSSYFAVGNNIIARLPIGFRPAYYFYCTGVSDVNTIVPIVIDSNGDVKITVPASNKDKIYSLGISYYAGGGTI